MTSAIPPLLRASRVRLELLGREHSAGMFELWSDPRVCEHSGAAEDLKGNPIPLPATSPADSDRLIAYWVHRAEAGSGHRWAVIREADSEFVGAVGPNSRGPHRELAYHFISRSWGQGLATEACRVAMAWMFQTGAQSVSALIEDGNQRSLTLARRLGFDSDPEASESPRRYSVRRPERAG